jgi:hypothetical protein
MFGDERLMQKCGMILMMPCQDAMRLQKYAMRPTRFREWKIQRAEGESALAES